MEVYDMANHVKPIRIKFSDKEYVLEYNRKTVVFINDMGFERTNLENNPEKMIPLLLFGAFQWHHKMKCVRLKKPKRSSQTLAASRLKSLKGSSNCTISRLTA